MRFLHSKTLEFHEFPNHKEIEYAILSHTWGDEEILFQDISGFTIPTTPPTIKQKSGYKKIEACCAQADSDGFEYVWIDTCCIDKRSSAELSEAINSMYQWYRDCIVCYAYLTDVTNDLEAEAQRDKFKASRWFTRGWTLQELIAPHVLEFYGNQWYTQGQKASLGTKLSLRNEISDITDIPLPVLKNAQDLNRRSIAQKMSWAASRITTRIEDRAYCLMGLFDVHMPLLYGEGDRSFVRLQEEIMNISDDETIFAWMPNEEDGYIQGLIANSPAYFKNSGNMLTDRKEGSQRTTPITVTSFGLGLELFLPETLRILDAAQLDKHPRKSAWISAD
ncbi:HET-domain-containing protein [Mollisia scopiformis]|uniref:HET-domain-containing protein n=1 Tax=Mollisia scopiformis TaxID=149040 RepID=A0A132BDM8_MOLSC|nr:HET-domain-containing protein [Mollisia scopiformis]KUJ10353.1 HET-domain-containing protein [Mollisia scopiformis]